MELFPKRRQRGLRSMEKKAQLLRGKRAVQSTPDEGAGIIAKFSCEENESDSK